MSDDEYYNDGDEDFYDVLYDADPAPDLADDLAERSAHSPIYLDNPTGELGDYFSDWDYYSDDYYDDDPVLLGTEASGIQSTAQASLPAKRGRKRKLSEAREPASKIRKEEKIALLRSLRGTVWKEPTPEPAPIFKMGQEKPVALFLSTAIMQAAYNKKQGFGKGRLRRDESWANDLSLADMGLKTERTLSFHERTAMEEQDDADEDEADEEAIEDDEMAEDYDTEGHALMADQYNGEPRALVDSISSDHEEAEIDGHELRKRRRMGTSTSDGKTSLLTPGTSVESGNLGLNHQHAETAIEQTPAKRSNGRQTKKDTVVNESKEVDAANDVSKTTSRKRKLSISEASGTGSTASSRAKRSATMKDDVTKTAASSRPSRNKKK